MKLTVWNHLLEWYTFKDEMNAVEDTIVMMFFNYQLCNKYDGIADAWNFSVWIPDSSYCTAVWRHHGNFLGRLCDNFRKFHEKTKTAYLYIFACLSMNNLTTNRTNTPPSLIWYSAEVPRLYGRSVLKFRWDIHWLRQLYKRLHDSWGPPVRGRLLVANEICTAKR